jgi:hypothetical protein
MFPLIFVLSFVAVYCGYEIIAGTTFDRDGASMVRGMRTLLQR